MDKEQFKQFLVSLNEPQSFATSKVQYVEFPYIDKDTYISCTTILKREQSEQDFGLESMVKIFLKSLPQYQKRALSDTSVPKLERQARGDKVAAEYEHNLNYILDNKDIDERYVNVITLCRLREHSLLKQGFTDVFLQIKYEEDEKALKLLQVVLKSYDKIKDDRKRFIEVAKGIFAGNKFDLGSVHSADSFDANPADQFRITLEGLQQRPWLVDDLDLFMDKLFSQNQNERFNKAIVFVDNAGSDIILGMLPFMRELLRSKVQVVIACNEFPAINDVTYTEMVSILGQVQQLDKILRQAVQKKQLKVVSQGSDLPVMDFKKVSQQLVTEAKDADLMVLEGMGRALESNYKQNFSISTVKVGMAKHPEIAQSFNGKLFDCIFKFDHKTYRSEQKALSLGKRKQHQSK